MNDDPRCCGTGTCLINSEGTCWCGQRWDGEKMCFADPKTQPVAKQLGGSFDSTAPAAPKPD